MYLPVYLAQFWGCPGCPPLWWFHTAWSVLVMPGLLAHVAAHAWLLGSLVLLVTRRPDSIFSRDGALVLLVLVATAWNYTLSLLAVN